MPLRHGFAIPSGVMLSNNLIRYTANFRPLPKSKKLFVQVSGLRVRSLSQSKAMNKELPMFVVATVVDLGFMVKEILGQLLIEHRWT